ncbi:uncharacterized protein LOC110723465 [Chenopodium quinoa]|uniref:uncharacterized protein LOC110723465 n=1 Tax=Chenopodium quinoa TaxID=63459 RepID=UPI000B7917C6|nr:uncharacterized protein LOC110723465 [Chenopodium quinoa]
MVAHFRPISLCNTIYKCIAKSLVNRMKGLLQNLIMEYQHAFISGRYMEDNIILSHELLHLINTNRGEVHKAAIKIDMSKAYDRVNWLFLLKILQAYGFPPRWVQWISQCISTVSYRTLVNGQVSEAFKPSCGLRKGDPLSPYLLLFCMDILSKMLIMGGNLGQIKGLKVTKESCQNLTNIIDRYGGISGQRLNLGKSFVKFRNLVPRNQMEEFKEILKIGQVQNLGLHLGAPVDLARGKKDSFQYMIDKVVQKITTWGTLRISQSAKLILINSVLISISSHVMKFLKLLGYIVSKIDALIARFFWAKNGEKGMHWVGKETLQLPKGMGGLGVRGMENLNDALLFQQVARMHCNPQILLPMHSCTMCDRRPHSELRGNASWGRRGFHNVANKFSTGFSWKIGNGEKVKYASMKWVNGEVPILKSSLVLRGMGLGMVRDLINNSSVKEWKAEVVREKFEWSLAQQNLDLELPVVENEDFLYWQAHKSGREELSSPGEEQLFKLIWKLKIPPKWSLFLWKLILNELAIKANLHHRGIPVDVLCSVCGDIEEDAQHLFRLCSLARYAWLACPLHISSEIDGSTPLQQWIQRHILLFYNEDGISSDCIHTFIGVLWGLWMARNGRVFRNEDDHTSSLVRHLDLAGKELNVFLKPDGGTAGILQELRPVEGPPPGFHRVHMGGGSNLSNRWDDNFREVTIICDGSWHKQIGNGGFGWAYATHVGVYVDGGAVGVVFARLVRLCVRS